MVSKHFVLAALALMLVLPFAFAEDGASRGEWHSKTSVPGQARTATTDAAACPVPSHEVCQGGTTEYKVVDDKGCVEYKCKPVPAPTPTPIPSSSEVSISLTSDSQVTVGSQIKAVGEITYNGNPNLDNIAAKKFKVVINYHGSGSSLSAQQGRIRFADASNTQGDAISAIRSWVAAIAPQKAEAKEAEASETAQDDESSESHSGGSVVAAVATSTDASASPQERTDYVTLRPGESTSVAAFFIARSPGEKLVRMRVYENTGTTCPSDGTPPVGAPCREDYSQVAETSSRVTVTGQVTPPSPPTVNETTTVASGLIELHTGWNMVSIPVSQRLSMQKLVEQCGSQETAWRMGQNGYVKERELAPGYGYWVKASKDCKLEVSAGSYTSSLSELSVGWNLVGAPGQETTFASYTGNCQITAGPWYYSPSSAADSPYVLSSVLMPGKAYWIKAASACSLGSPDGTPPAPPA